MPATIGLVVFFILATVGIFSALVVVTGKNMVHNVLFFGLFLLSVSGLYFLLSADFLAMAQIFGYVGGVVVLILFVVMLTRKVTEAEIDTSLGRGNLAVLMTIVLLGSMFYAYRRTFFKTVTALGKEHSASAIGRMLLSSHAIPFELAAIVLLVAIIGALSIVREGSR